MEREHDSRYDDRETDRGGRGYHHSARGGYRGGRSPGRHQGYRGPRSPRRSPPRRSPPPHRRGRTPPQYSNDYAAKDNRYDDNSRNNLPYRRSRSPPVRGRGNGDPPYRIRPRSPPRNERRRSPGGYGRPRPPYDQQSYEEQDGNTAAYRQYQQGNNRFDDAPEDDFDRRDEPGPVPGPESKRYPRDGGYRGRGRSRSPHQSSHPSHGGTPGSSRRSSPRGYADRPRGGRYDQGSDRPSPRYAGREHSPRRGASPGGRSPPRRGYSPKSPREGTGWQRARDAPQAQRDSEYPPRDRGHPPQSRDSAYIGQTSRTWRKPEANNSGPPRDDVPSPSAPPGYGDHNIHSPPAGPPPSHRPDMSSAPTQPRGRGGPPQYGRDSRDSRDPRDSRDYRESRDPRDGPPYGGGRGRGGYSGPPGGRSSYDSRSGRPPAHQDGYGPPVSPPPRDSGPPRDRDRDRERGPVGEIGGRPTYPPPFRSNNSSSGTYPQTRFFNNAGPRNKHPLGNLEKMVDGGKKAPSALEPSQEKRLQQLEEESRKLQEQIEEKERAKRKSLRDWESAERESRLGGLRSELAEGHLERLGGEGSGGNSY